MATLALDPKIFEAAIEAALIPFRKQIDDMRLEVESLERRADRVPPEEPYKVQDTHRFQILDGAGDAIAQCRVYQEHGVHWLTDIWTDSKHRRKGLARKVVRQAVAAYGADHNLHLNVVPYGSRPASASDLMSFYGEFEFVATVWPGGMIRYAGPIDPVMVKPDREE